jgi:proteasome assembly chaperone (PAC2) family protein
MWSDLGKSVMGKLVLAKQPALHAPYLVAGFAGWPNGGGVSTDVVDFLKSYLGAERIGEITAEDLYIYSSPSLASRPIVTIHQGLMKSMYFPTNELYVWKDPEEVHDLLLLQGIEPDLRWDQFAAAVLECMQTFGVQRLYTIGGYLDYAPHTRVPRISAVATHATLQQALKALDVELTDYEGPTSIQSYLLSLCQERDIEGVSLWGGTPSYIQGAYPKVIHSMLRLLSQMWHLSLELSIFQEQTDELETSLHEQIDSNPELADYIKRLEQAYDLEESEQPQFETDTIVDEIQQFLRRRRDNPDGG